VAGDSSGGRSPRLHEGKARCRDDALFVVRLWCCTGRHRRWSPRRRRARSLGLQSHDIGKLRGQRAAGCQW